MVTKRVLFIVNVEHVAPHLRDAELEDLQSALRTEFPAFWIGHSVRADDYAAVVVMTDEPRADFSKLDGWGHGWLTLCAVQLLVKEA